ncbi:MAG: DNA recombination protein RmuC, partial [Psychromonas sp.]
FDKKIVLVTPSTLLATLKTVESIWKNERTTRNTLEISRQAGAMYDKFVGFVGDLEKVGKKQNEAQLAYDEAVKKLSVGKGNLVNSAQKLKKLGLTTKKELDKKLLGDDDDLD